MCAGTALRKKTYKTIDEGDLYAASLLSILSCVHFDSFKFGIHLNGTIAIMNEFSRNVTGRAPLSRFSTLFFPLLRDLIIEMSRHVYGPSTDIIQFLNTSRNIMGPIRFQNRAQYHSELYGIDFHRHNSFSHAIWHHCTVLRRCFREVLIQQIERGDTSISVLSLISEVESDLKSANLVWKVKSSSLVDPQAGRIQDELTFTLLLYDFCIFLTILSQARTIIKGSLSPEAISLARSMLHRLESRWLDLSAVDFITAPPAQLRRFVLIRILWMVGLSLNLQRHPQGTFRYKYVLIMTFARN